MISFKSDEYIDLTNSVCKTEKKWGEKKIF